MKIEFIYDEGNFGKSEYILRPHRDHTVAKNATLGPLAWNWTTTQVNYEGRCRELDREFCIYSGDNTCKVMGIFNEYLAFTLESIFTWPFQKNSKRPTLRCSLHIWTDPVDHISGMWPIRIPHSLSWHFPCCTMTLTFFIHIKGQLKHGK